MTFVMIELPSNEALSTVSGSVDATRVGSSLNQTWYSGLLGSWFFVNNRRKDDGTVEICSRMIMHNGALEDPATGSAASAFSVYFAKGLLARRKEESVEGFVTEFDIEQGVDMGRPSCIRTRVVLDSETDVRRVVLGGSAVQVNGRLPCSLDILESSMVEVIHAGSKKVLRLLIGVVPRRIY